MQFIIANSGMYINDALISPQLPSPCYPTFSIFLQSNWQSVWRPALKHLCHQTHFHVALQPVHNLLLCKMNPCHSNLSSCYLILKTVWLQCTLTIQSIFYHSLLLIWILFEFVETSEELCRFISSNTDYCCLVCFQM